MKERTKLLLIILTFACAYYIPWDHPTIRQSGLESFMMLQEYAGEHVLTWLIPAFFIAGAIAVAGSSAAMVKGVLENSRWQGATQWFRKGAGVVIIGLAVYFVVNPFVSTWHRIPCC